MGAKTKEKLLTLKEIAKAVGCAAGTVRKILDQKNIPYETYGSGGMILISKEYVYTIKNTLEKNKKNSMDNIKKFNEKKLNKNSTPDNVVHLHGVALGPTLSNICSMVSNIKTNMDAYNQDDRKSLYSIGEMLSSIDSKCDKISNIETRIGLIEERIIYIDSTLNKLLDLWK
jgi:flagellin-like hook-associated protein FlgL